MKQGCGVVPARKEAVEDTRKRRIWRLDTREARRAGKHVQEPKVRQRYELSRATTSRYSWH